jgi:hypothetical protein
MPAFRTSVRGSEGAAHASFLSFRLPSPSHACCHVGMRLQLIQVGSLDYFFYPKNEK